MRMTLALLGLGFLAVLPLAKARFPRAKAISPLEQALKNKMRQGLIPKRKPKYKPVNPFGPKDFIFDPFIDEEQQPVPIPQLSDQLVYDAAKEQPRQGYERERQRNRELTKPSTRREARARLYRFQRRKLKRWLAGGAVVLAVVAIGAGVGIALGRDDSYSPPPSPPPSQTNWKCGSCDPTQQPSSSGRPSKQPSLPVFVPSKQPAFSPSVQPSSLPQSYVPIFDISEHPSSLPPSLLPSWHTPRPSGWPTEQPAKATVRPSAIPPSGQPNVPEPSHTIAPEPSPNPSLVPGYCWDDYVRFYIAFNAPLTSQVPTAAEYSSLLSLTAAYYETQIQQALAAKYPNVFYNTAGDMAIGTSVDSKQYEAGIPEERFNIYIEFDSGYFVSCSAAIVPANQLFEIVQGVDLADYINKVTKSAALAMTPFEFTVEVISGPVLAGPKFEVRNQALFDLVAGVSSDAGASIRVIGSPQNLAYTWLENDSEEQSLSESRKIQRYALACFYHSTDGENWSNNGGWLTATDECLWHNDAVDTFTCTGETLNVLQFSQNNIGGVLPPELGLLTGLTRLVILNHPDGTGMAGGCPVELQALTLMKEIELEGNSFSEPIPPELFQSWNLLDVMLLNGNGIPGPIPTTIGNLAATRINLGNNQFNGTIPTEIGGLSNVLLFTLSENQLTGPIPTTIGLLTSAKGVYLNGNDLSGDVPPELGNLESIRGGLDISNNKLSGTIPPAIASRPNLKSFLVQNNEMTGPIPDFSALINLREIRIDGNKFTGTVPEGTCTAILNKGAEAYADCPDEVVCLCCTFCCNRDGVCSPP